MDTIKSNLIMNNLAFTKISINRSFELSNCIEIVGSFNVKYEEINDEEINVYLSYNAKSKKEDLTIELELKGKFSVFDIEDEDVKRYLLHVNSIAIMFPFLRSQISIVTTQPGLVPIQIPIVNAISLAREAGFVDKK